jgi:type VI secretion system secreted protein Hcp
MAAVDIFLKLEGIKGESSDSKHKDQIEIESFSWGAVQTGTGAHGGGSGAGKVSFQDFHFTTKVSKASPLLMLACATGQHIKTAELTVRKAGGKQEDYYVVKLNGAFVSSFQSGGHGGADVVPTDQCSLNFAKIEFSLSPQDETGKLSAATKAGWDLKANKKL